MRYTATDVTDSSMTDSPARSAATITPCVMSSNRAGSQVSTHDHPRVTPSLHMTSFARAETAGQMAIHGARQDDQKQGHYSVCDPSTATASHYYHPPSILHSPHSSYRSSSSSSPYGHVQRLLLLSLTLAALTAVAVGVSSVSSHNTQHEAVPTSLRNAQRSSEIYQPEVEDSQSSLSLLSTAQLMDKSGDCAGNRSQCLLMAMCADHAGDVLCRCPTGHYKHGHQCRECDLSCPEGHYLVTPCSVSADRICKPCTKCRGSQYEAAMCTSTTDTLCVDVTFPVEQLVARGTQCQDDGTPIAVSHSSNVFLERLVHMKELETPMYVTNNQQTQDFVWHRESGIDIVVGISGVYLIPEYRELDVDDDSQFFLTQGMQAQNTLDLFARTRRHYCRHPVPDYYYLHLEVIKNRTTAAQVVRCDSQDPSVPKCPQSYKDGDRYLKWDINTHCDKYQQYLWQASGRKPKPLTVLRDGFNTVVCGDETAMDRDIFELSRPVTLEMMFPSAECSVSRTQCQQCLASASCSDADEDLSCCGVSCYTKEPCQRVYSPSCPPATVECGQGEVHMFTVMPSFPSMAKEWQCHLSYQQPSYLYNISYSLSIPSLGIQIPIQTYTATSGNLSQHHRHSDMFHFIQIGHNTRMPVFQDILLKGNHGQLNSTNMNHMQPYVVHSLKHSQDFSRQKGFFTTKKGESAFTTAVQFERPFLYSSTSWYKGGCDKNMSRIFPNQTLHRNDAMKVTAKKVDKGGNFWYQVSHIDKSPYIKLSVREGESVLRWVQGEFAHGTIVEDSLAGILSWDYVQHHWTITVTGTLKHCPAILTLQIFNKTMSSCAGKYDIVVACPNNFSMTFNLSRTEDALPDIFVLILNDTAVSHQLVLSSVIPPVSLPVSDQAAMEQLSYAVEEDLFQWSSIFSVISLSALGLVAVCVVYVYIKHTSSRASTLPGQHSSQPTETITLNNQPNNMATKPPDTKQTQSPLAKTCLCVFVVLYLAYSLIFTFCVTLTILYFTHHALTGQVSGMANFSSQLQSALNSSFHKVQLHESQEEVRLFRSVDSRLEACTYHLQQQNQHFLHNYVSVVSDFLNHVYLQDGAIDSLAGHSILQNTSIYAEEIEQFLLDCNKTVQSVLDRIESHYLTHVKEITRNGWLDFPREIFLTEEGDSADRRYMSSDQQAHFLHWLRLDKTDQLLAAPNMAAKWLTDLEPPSPRHHLRHSVSSPFDHLLSSLPPEPRVATHTFQVLDRPDPHTASPIFPSPTSTDSVPPQPKTAFLYSEGPSPQVDVHSGDRSGVEDRSRSEPLLAEEDDTRSEGESRQGREEEKLGVMTYVMIGVFLLLDVVLFVFRMSWMVNQLTAAKAGYEDRIPTDPVCQKLLAIQTGYHLTRMQDMYQNHSYSLENKENVTAEEKRSMNEFNVFFCQSYPKSKDDILREIMAQKMNSTEQNLGQEAAVDTLQQQSARASRHSHGLREVCSCCHWLYRMLISHLLWRFVLTALAVLFLCLLVYTVDFWLTTDSLRVSFGGYSAAHDLRAQVHMTNRYLTGVASHLSAVLEDHTAAMQSEVSLATALLSSTLLTQRKLLHSLLEELCSRAVTPTCNASSFGALPSPVLPTWLPCNFIPAQPLLYQDVSGGSLDEMVAQQLSPLLQMVKHSLFSLCAIVIAVLCLMFLCHAGATVARYYMLIWGHLPRVHIFQISENTSLMFDGGPDKPMQRSASWLESCESGVYVGENELEPHPNRDV